MRLLLVVLAAVVSLPVIATAQVSKQVEVTNFPAVQDVNIVGGTAPSAAPRFQIVGFTTATYIGDLGGHFGATQKCQLEFPESRMCTTLEARETTSLPGGLTGFAWVNSNSPLTTCDDWVAPAGTGRKGGVVSGETGVSTVNWNCDPPQPIACCALVP